MKNSKKYYKGFTKPIKKKLGNIERLYNFYSRICEYGDYIRFDDKFIEQESGYMIKLTLIKEEGVFVTTYSLWFSEIYIKSNEYIDIYRDICKQIKYIKDITKGDNEE